MVVRSPRTASRPNFVKSIMKIRNFEEDDLSQVIELVEDIFSEAYDPELYLNLSKEWGEGVIVAEFGTIIIGFLLATVQKPLQSRVLILGISEEYRGLGVGKALMRTIINRSIIKGNRTMTLEVRMSNDMALAFYSRLGFEIIGLIPKFYSDGESAFLLRRALY